MPAVSKRRRNLTVSLFTSIVILALLLFYVLEHIPNNERRINTRNFRVLARIGINLNATIKSYQDNVVSNYAHFTFSQLPDIPDSNEAIPDFLIEKFNNNELKPRYRLEYDPVKDDSAGVFHLKDKYLHFSEKADPFESNRRQAESNRGRESSGSKWFTFYARMSIDSLLPSLHRNDIFEHLLVLQAETVRVKDEDKIKGKVIYNSSSFYPSLFQIDSLVNTRHGLLGGEVVDVEFAGVPYKLYLLGQDVGLKDKWILAGAVPLNQFRAERMAIDSSLVVFILLALAILVLALPFIKLVLMNKQERLHKRDVLLSAFSLFAGVSLIVLMLFDSYSYLGPDSFTKRNQLKDLADRVAHQLNQEIWAATEQLTELDRLEIEKENIISLNSKEVKWEGTEQPISDPKLKLSKYPDMIRVFWADSVGKKLCTWTTRSENNENNSVANREYFSTINQGKGWVRKGKQEQEKQEQFYLQSILSWSDGKKYAMISKKSQGNGNAKVIALTTKLSSLTHSTVPPGYGFFLINQEGEVLFHKDEDLNLNENMLEESGYNQHLQAAIFSYIPTYFEEHYQGSTHQFFIQPLADLPLFMVTYVNRSYQSASKVNTISLAVSLLLFYFFFLSIQLGLPVLLTTRNSKLKFHQLSFRWLWPQRQEQKTVAYWRVAMVLLFTIGVIMWMTDRDRPVASFFILLLAVNYTFTFAYFSIRNLRWENLFRDESKYVMYISAGSALLLNLICLFLYEDYKWVILFQVILAVGLKIICSLRLSPFNISREYQRAYILMVLFWLFLTSVMPSFFVFRIAYDYEAELMVRYHQLHLAHDISVKRHQQKEPKEKREPNQPEENFPKGNSIYTDFFYLTKETTEPNPREDLPVLAYQNQPAETINLSQVIQSAPGQEITEAGVTNAVETVKPKERLLLNFIHFVRPVFKNVLANEIFLINIPSTRATWRFKPATGFLNMAYTNYADPECSVYLSSQLPLFQLPDFTFIGENTEQVMLSGGFFWLEVLLLLVFLFMLVNFLINRVFNLNLLDNLKMRQVDQALLDYRVENKVLLISMPGTPEMCFINPGYPSPASDKTYLTKKPVHVKEVDLARPGNWPLLSNLNIKPEDMVVVVKNFDHEPYEEKWIQQKMEMLQYLESLQGKKIILYSAEHPSKWEEKLKESILTTENSEVAAGKESISKSVRLLLHHLNRFTKVYMPLQGMLGINECVEAYNKKLSKTSGKPWNKPASEENSRLKYLLHLVKAECLSCHHLTQFEKSLQDYVSAHYKEKKITRSDIILKVQSLAQLYYRELWSKCSEEEHYMLYDLAQDGLVNARNVGVLSSLLNKGLLVRERKLTLRLFNESFRNFVLTVVDKEEALRYEKDTATGSRWETYRTPLFMVLAGAMLFIFYTQKDTWSMMLAVLTALSTMAGVLPRLGFLVPAFLAKGEGK